MGMSCSRSRTNVRFAATHVEADATSLYLLHSGGSLLVVCVCITVAVTLLDVIERHAARRLTEAPEDSEADHSSTTVLDLSGALQSHAGR
jgi:hypothetical protein